MRALFRALCLHAIRRGQYRGGGTVGKHRKPWHASTPAARSIARSPALPGAGGRSRPLQGTLTPRIFGNRESDQRRESVKSFANALIDALQRIAVALERIAERMK